jgi:hypothetical protein
MNRQIDGVDNNDLWHNVPAVNQGGVGHCGHCASAGCGGSVFGADAGGPEGGRNPGG